jgi:hypothetical protein
MARRFSLCLVGIEDTVFAFLRGVQSFGRYGDAVSDSRPSEELNSDVCCITAREDDACGLDGRRCIPATDYEV